MFANFLIGLREGLEAALVVSILIAYLMKSGRRILLPRIWLGVGIATAVSLAFGAALTFGPKGLTFEAQELVGGMLSIVAVGFVTWMIFWLAKASCTISGGLRAQIDKAAGARPWSLAVVAMLAVGREGLETALFLWAATQAAARDAGATAIPLIGAALGLAVAVLLGYLIYRGAVKINLTRFFTWSGAFLIIVAAGVLAYGVHDLQEARFLPGLNRLAFDVSYVIPPSSWYGTLLKGVFNFSPATTKLEAAAWLLYAVPTLALFIRRIRSSGPTASSPRTIPAHHPRGARRKEMIMTARMLRAGLTPYPAHRLVAVCAAVALLVLAACTDNAPAASSHPEANPRTLAVQATDTSCTLSVATAPSGKLTFSVTNGGNKVTEFYLLGEDNLRIVAEIENIGPGLTRDLVLNAAAGSYFTACKPGMVGEGIRSAFAISESGEDGPTGNDVELVEQADRQYQAYVKDQTEQLVAKTEQFVALYKAGKDDQARALYAPARVHWERIEPVAESFGDLDPKVDLREADLEKGQKWTGWHRIEKDLWPARAKGYQQLSMAERATAADDLMRNTDTLYNKTRNLTFTADEIANGARGLLDEVATGKVTGEEEYWSRTDLWDFQANVDGARVGFEGLRPLLATKDPALDSKIDASFDALQKLLDAHRSGAGFVTYDRLSQPQIKALSDAVNALSEPLSMLAATVA